MADEKQKQAKTEKEDKKVIAENVKKSADEVKATEAPISKEQAKITPKVDVNKEPAKVTPKLAKKDEATAKGNSLHASMKQCMYICRFIKNKSIDEAIEMLEDVIKMKKVVPFSGEIPHRHGMMSGRYPINASKLFIPILKTLRGNVLVNQMDLDKARIYFASSSYASRPSKRGGGRFKRTNIILKVKELGTPQGESPQQSEELRSKRGQREESKGAQ